jgi:hypothetical protein
MRFMPPIAVGQRVRPYAEDLQHLTGVTQTVKIGGAHVVAVRLYQGFLSRYGAAFGKKDFFVIQFRVDAPHWDAAIIETKCVLDKQDK